MIPTHKNSGNQGKVTQNETKVPKNKIKVYVPKKRWYHGMTTNNDDTIFMFGGSGTQYLNDLWKIKVKRHDKFKWEKIKTDNEIEIRCQHGLIYDNNKLYVFGGWNKIGRTLNDFHFLNLNDDPRILCWERIKITNAKKMHSFSCNLYKNKILIFGGIIDNKICNELYFIDMNTKEMNKIEIKNNIIIERVGHDTTILHDKLFIFGGYKIQDTRLYYIDLKDNYKLNYIESGIECRYGFNMLSWNSKFSLNIIQK